ncbi:MAG: hypothetical protein LBK55_08985, partial [Azoarcus sp.]|nr:hypothetical protein [Azoarcus sp.]
LLTKKPIGHMIKSTVVFIDLTPKISTQINLYYRKGEKLTTAEMLFLESVQSYLSSFFGRSLYKF